MSLIHFCPPFFHRKLPTNDARKKLFEYIHSIPSLKLGAPSDLRPGSCFPSVGNFYVAFLPVTFIAVHADCSRRETWVAEWPNTVKQLNKLEGKSLVLSISKRTSTAIQSKKHIPEARLDSCCRLCTNPFRSHCPLLLVPRTRANTTDAERIKPLEELHFVY